jgi:hypothetical protein
VGRGPAQGQAEGLGRSGSRAQGLAALPWPPRWPLPGPEASRGPRARGALHRKARTWPGMVTAAKDSFSSLASACSREGTTTSGSKGASTRRWQSLGIISPFDRRKDLHERMLGHGAEPFGGGTQSLRVRRVQMRSGERCVCT